MGTNIKGQYMNRSTFRMINYMNGSVFSKARNMNGVGFEILARTPIPQLPPNYRPATGSLPPLPPLPAPSPPPTNRNIFPRKMNLTNPVI